jgi:ribosome recycling factor
MADKKYPEQQTGGSEESVSESVAPYNAAQQKNTPSFNDILEAADKLSLDEQEDVVRILKKRITERRREEIVKNLKASEEEVRKGEYKEVTPEELKKELLY